jgi:NTP pyrophosphatase (non-canonical NTP hydrolase)
MNMTNIAKIKQIADHYSYNAQREMLIEECAELIQAAQKLKRVEGKVPYPTEAAFLRNFVQELADVSIMVEQMKYFLTPELYNEYEDAVTMKIDRQISRIEKEQE